MSAYEFFADIVVKIEQLQETLNQLKGIIRMAVEENASPKTARAPEKVSNDASE